MILLRRKRKEKMRETMKQRSKRQTIKTKKKQHLRSVASNHVNLLYNHHLKRKKKTIFFQRTIANSNFFPSFVYTCQREKHNIIDEGFI